MYQRLGKRRSEAGLISPAAARAFGPLAFDRRIAQSEGRDDAFAEAVRSIPRGKVATYGQVAAAAGYPRYHRAVARLLKGTVPNQFPWQRVVGAGGEIKVIGPAAAEQRLRLRQEGVTFTGKKVNLAEHQYSFDEK